MEAFEQLEQSFGEWIGNPNCVAVASGTAALHLALESFELPKRSQVLVPEFAMIACARACTMAGLNPSFIDCDEKLNMDVCLLPKALSRYTRAIMPVHTYGRKCDMEGIFLKLPQECLVVEDMSEIHGVNPHPLSHAACYSFYRNKIIAGEEGGMIVFRNPEHVHIAKELRCQGFTKDHNFLHRPRGVNARMSNVHANLIGRSLESYERNSEDRRQIEKWYDALIDPKWKQSRRDAVWVYDIRIPGLERDQQDGIIAALKEHGIQARHGFKPMSEQPEYRTSHSAYRQLAAYKASKEIIYLPVYPGQTKKEIKNIVECLETAVSAISN